MMYEQIDLDKLHSQKAPMCVKHLMSTDLFTVYEDDNIQLVDDLMKWRRIRHIPVINQENKFVGLITHRDLLKASISSLTEIREEEQRDINTHIPTNAIMQRDVLTVHPETTLKEAAVSLIDNKFGCLLVIDDGALIGIITEADFVRLVNAMLSNK